MTFKKGFSYLEIVMVVGLIAVFLLVLTNWYRGYSVALNKTSKYYDDRNELINKVEAREGTEIFVTDNVYLKTVSVNSLSVDYLLYK